MSTTESSAAVHRPRRCSSTGSGFLPVRAQTSRSTSPATGEVIATVPEGDREDARAAIAAAGRAAEGWSRLTAYERAAYMHAVGDVIEGRRDELARTLTLDQGKPLRAEAGDEVDELVDLAGDGARRRAAGHAHRPRGETFGPVAPVVAVVDDAEALALHQRLAVRAAARRCSRADLRRGLRFAEAVRSGVGQHQRSTRTTGRATCPSAARCGQPQRPWPGRRVARPAAVHRAADRGPDAVGAAVVRGPSGSPARR